MDEISRARVVSGCADMCSSTIRFCRIRNLGRDWNPFESMDGFGSEIRFSTSDPGLAANQAVILPPGNEILH